MPGLGYCPTCHKLPITRAYKPGKGTPLVHDCEPREGTSRHWEGTYSEWDDWRATDALRTALEAAHSRGLDIDAVIADFYSE